MKNIKDYIRFAILIIIVLILVGVPAYVTYFYSYMNEVCSLLGYEQAIVNMGIIVDKVGYCYTPPDKILYIYPR